MELSLMIVAYGVRWAVETAFLLLALWFMVKVQKLQFNIPGLLLSAALASAFDLIPYVGHYIAVPVLWATLTKVTREDFTGVAFTAAVSYALVFGMNLFLLGGLMGDLRPSVRARSLPDAYAQKALTTDNEEEVDDSPATSSEDSEATNTPVAVQPGNATAKPSPSAPAQAANPASDPGPATAFVLKGVTQNGKNSMALINTGTKTYTLFLNETISVETSAGTKRVRLDKVDKSSILLDVSGQPVKVTDAPPH